MNTLEGYIRVLTELDYPDESAVNGAIMTEMAKDIAKDMAVGHSSRYDVSGERIREGSDVLQAGRWDCAGAQGVAVTITPNLTEGRPS